MASSVRFGVLGPLVAEDAHGPLALKGPRHRAVLARLLVARGRVVPVERLAADLWDDPPERAAGAIQTFVAALRKALEPQRPPRTPARLLVTVAPGYALRAEPDAVDAWRFETALTACGDLLAAGQARAALTKADEALGLWRGPAYAEFAEHPWARAEASRLEELRLLAWERRAEALLELGRAAEAVPELESQVDGHPWREGAWRLLALALYRAGRQGDALTALRRARAVLAEDLGVDPGPALARLEADVLAHAGHLDPPPGSGGDAAGAGPGLVGRTAELAALDEAAADTAAHGRLRLVLLSGEAGAGKTALAETLATRLAARGWTTAWGASPEHEGVPAGWPWTRILDALAESGNGPPPAPRPGDPLTARFHWQQDVAAYLAGAARSQPLLLVLDDLHWAGEATLELLASLSTDPVPGPVLLVATYRATELSGPLAALLGRVARVQPTRIYLGGLSAGAVSDLVRALAGPAVDDATARRIHRRSGGNPFFVRELARLLDGEGADRLTGAPPGVRDVVRYRVAALPEAVQDVLRRATVLGAEFDLDLLASLAGGPERVLDAAETALRRGFLVEQGARRFRFAHALVRDALYEDLSESRRAGWHAAVADLLERLRPGDVDALAQHFLLAGTAGTDARAAHYAQAAAERAEARFAPHEAARLWQAALAAHERAGDDEPRRRLTLLMGLVRALAFTGELGRARTHRAEALALAESVGDPALTARAIAAFDVPAVWTEHDDPALAARVAEVTERTLAALPPERVADRARLLATLALELRSTGGERARAAAEEAERLARGLDDPAVLAFALNARFMQSFERAGLAPRRAAIGAELTELAARSELGGFEVLGHLVLVQAHAAPAHFGAADRHANAADDLAERHRLPLVGVFTGWYAALRASVAGRDAEAQAAYRVAAARLGGTGMSGMDNGIGPFALLCHRLQQGLPPETEPDANFGGYAPWCRPLLLLARGRTAEARQAAAAIPESPPDLLLEARLGLHALTAVALGDRPAMDRLHTALLPAADELAGAGSGLVTLRPVAHYLGLLASALGRHREAADHAEQAAAVAARAGARHWAEPARALRG
ncbi:BTAD domain-containing putative transcriptional regulator [Prauserella muralis]|uniref:SARP family transcriptional regulator n=1 Tax=Prauserella muralis TaxID=588067 RepID=A0A2V4AKB0_9PSEU|nr:BTAD domain-containing putative transcriptional regulator [Prauserella muralis]PXY20707.1 SARP family transcriptional regulator [Prauserella muralis]TWE29713.1 transcriptional regulator [Prauserella muralis]